MVEPLTLVWSRSTLEFVLEGRFIREALLAGLQRPVRQLVIEAGQALPMRDHLLLVSLNDEMAPYLVALKRAGRRHIGLLHMGDEQGDQPRGHYAQADYVLRHYWFPKLFAESPVPILWLPNGYANAVGPSAPALQLPYAQRETQAFFSGALSARTLLAERKQMVETALAHQLPFMLMETSGFGRGLKAPAYAAHLGNSRYALVPAGNSPETIRLYDAIENGAMPICLRSDFLHAPQALGAIGLPPFQFLQNWGELPQRWAQLAAQSAEAGEAQRQALLHWWQRYMQDLQGRVAGLIEAGSN